MYPSGSSRRRQFLENLSDKPVHVDVPASNEFKVLGLGKVVINKLSA